MKNRAVLMTEVNGNLWKQSNDRHQCTLGSLDVDFFISKLSKEISPMFLGDQNTMPSQNMLEGKKNYAYTPFCYQRCLQKV